MNCDDLAVEESNLDSDQNGTKSRTRVSPIRSEEKKSHLDAYFDKKKAKKSPVLTSTVVKKSEGPNPNPSPSPNPNPNLNPDVSTTENKRDRSISPYVLSTGNKKTPVLTLTVKVKISGDGPEVSSTEKKRGRPMSSNAFLTGKKKTKSSGIQDGSTSSNSKKRKASVPEEPPSNRASSRISTISKPEQPVNATRKMPINPSIIGKEIIRICIFITKRIGKFKKMYVYTYIYIHMYIYRYI
jgi:hypothetical protein